MHDTNFSNSWVITENSSPQGQEFWATFPQILLALAPMGRCTAACQHQDLRKAWRKVTNVTVFQLVNSLILALRVCAHKHVQVCLTRCKHAIYLGRSPRVQEQLCPSQEPSEWPRQEAGCGDAPAQLHAARQESAARQSKPHLSLLVCVDTLNNCSCFPEQVSRLHYIFTCLARDRASTLINEEKGLLALQEIYVTVSLSAQEILCAVPHSCHP